MKLHSTTTAARRGLRRLHFWMIYFSVTLPIVIVSLTMIFTSYFQSCEKVRSNVHSQLSQSLEIILNAYNLYEYNALTLSFHEPMNPEKVLHDAIRERYAILELEKVEGFQNNNGRVALYYDNGFILTSLGRTGEITYLKQQLNLISSSITPCLDILKTDTPSLSYLTGVYDDYILFHFPFTNYLGRTCSVNFFQKASLFLSYFGSLTSFGQANLQIILPGGSELYALSSNASPVLVPCSKHEFTDLQQQSQRVFFEESLLNDQLQIRVWYPEANLFAEPRQLFGLNLLIVLLGILVTSLAALFVSGNHYRRLAETESLLKSASLLPAAEDAVPISDDPQNAQHVPQTMPAVRESRSMYQGIQTMVTQLVSASSILNERTIQMGSMLRGQTAAMIFHGVIRDNQAIEDMLANSRLEIPHGDYYLIGIQMEAHPALRDHLIASLEGKLWYQTKAADHPTIIYLCPIDRPDPLHTFRLEHCRDVGRRLLNAGASHIRMVSSRISHELSKIDIAVLEVTTTLELMNAEESDHIQELNVTCATHDTLNEERNDKKIEHLLTSYRAAIETYQVDEAVRYVRALCTIMNENVRSQKSNSYIRYSILNPLIAELGQSGNPEELELLDLTMKIDPLSNRDFSEQAIPLVQKYCLLKSGVNDFERIITYLDSHYMDDSLSQEHLSDMLGVSRSALSKLFAKNAGMTYIEYITSLRMKKAKELLETTDMPIQDVFQQVGYYTRSNYIKKFKDIYGITPSELRKDTPR